MKILHVASECAPFIKTGGLADVVGAIPKALAESDVKVLLPAYPALKKQLESGTCVYDWDELFGGPARLVSVIAEGIQLLLLDADHLFARGGTIYLDEHGNDWHDNYLRFGALSRIGADIGLGLLHDWQPDVVHAHDWQAGLVPVYLHQARKPKSKSVITIHNIAFQGLFDAHVRHELGIHEELFNSEAVEYWGKVGFLKAGIALADKITTVSPNYAQELKSPEFGMGLEGLIQARHDDLIGVLNGIDVDVWNPAKDPAIKRNYTVRSLNRKLESRTELEKKFGLEVDPTAPLFVVISRLTTQKGLDVLLEVLPDMVTKGAQLALLGSGDAGMEKGFLQAADKFAGRVGVTIGYDEDLSHLLQAGADAILIPSRFEPCGLTQLYALRYGTLPIVAETGGLADTVVDATPANIKSLKATGFTFSPVTSGDLLGVIERACFMFSKPKTWTQMQKTAMKTPVSWKKSAQVYQKIYTKLAS